MSAVLPANQPLPGLARIIDLLTAAKKENRVAHAYLFYGPPGAGKKELAFYFARLLFCSHDIPCGACPGCRMMAGGNHPDFFHVAPEGKKIKIETIRQLIQNIYLKPVIGPYRVCVIEEAENLTPEAANCFLKTLEEPPANTVIILTAINPYNLLPTIVSRCQQISLEQGDVAELTGYLVREKHLSQEEAEELAFLANGLPVRALEIAAGQEDEVRKIAEEVDRVIGARDLLAALELAEKLEDEERDWPDFLSLWYRDLLVWQITGEEKLLFNRSQRDKIKEKSEAFQEEELVYLIQLLERYKRYRSRNLNRRLLLEAFFIRAIAGKTIPGEEDHGYSHRGQI